MGARLPERIIWEKAGWWGGESNGGEVRMTDGGGEKTRKRSREAVISLI